MNRRKFGKYSMLGLLTGVITSCKSIDRINKDHISSGLNRFKPIKPPRLKRGDTIGLIAPSSRFSDEAYQKSVSQISSLGFLVKEGENIFKKYGNFAGTDEERIADIHSMFRDNEVQGIWCLRGGYGITRILPFLDFELIKNNPKILIGYSDVTALLHAIQSQTGLVGIHGPVGKSPFNDYTLDNLKKILFIDHQNFILKESEDSPDNELYSSEIITSGNMKGILSGGNLSLLSALAGTKYQWDATNKLVFIEEIGERPYRVDRMLTQLLQSSNLDKARGILLGVFNDCEKKPNEDVLSLKEVIRDRLGSLGIPVYYGFSFGHIDHICSLPVGINASFDTNQKTLTIVESIFSS